MISTKNIPAFVIIASLIGYGCSSTETSSKKPNIEVESPAPSTPEAPNQRKIKEGECVLFLLHVDNRAVIMVSDSIVYDTGMVTGGPYNAEVELTDFILNNQTDLKVELYNHEEMDIGLKPGWMIVLDVYVGADLVYFVNEKKNETKEGLVFAESFDLSGYLGD